MDFSEKLLYHIWDAQHIIKKPATVSGKQVIIMYQGQWNTDFGTDFRNSIISIDGQVLRGNIEIHLKTYDWTAHKHSEDANFNDTILHVVYEHNGRIPYTITENGNQVEILEIKNYLDQDLAKLIKKFDQAEVLCPDLCSFFAGMESNVTELMLTKLGVSRMEKKVKRYAAELFFSDFNQLLYQGILEAAGYSKNSYNMLQIAITYPYVDLLKWKEEGMEQEEMQAILIFGSGLEDYIPKSIRDTVYQRWQNAYNKQKLTDKSIDPDWNLFRIRPINHPVIRIIQAVNFIYQSLDNDLLSQFIKLFSENKSGKTIAKSFLKMFNQGNCYDKFHIGINRIDIVMINVILPVMILYADKTNNQMLKAISWSIYKEYPGLTPNHIESFMKQKYLNNSQQRLAGKKAVNQQGILKLYYDYCRYHNCSLCNTHKKDLIMNM